MILRHYEENIDNKINYDRRWRYDKKSKTHPAAGRLVVFGDSYFEDIPGKICWPSLLSERLNFDIVNYAVAGSSINYSVQQFFHYYRTDYNPKDYIIFGNTYQGRAPFTMNEGIVCYQNYLLTYLSEPGEPVDRREAIDEYYSREDNFWNVWFDQVFKFDDVDNQVELIYSFINNLTNKNLFLSAFDTLHTDQNLLKDKFSLHMITRMENYTNKDEINHMSIENKHKLAEQCYAYFEKLDYSVFDITYFEKDNE